MRLSTSTCSSMTMNAMVSFMQKNTAKKSLVNGIQAKEMSSEYIALCLSFLRKNQNLPAEVNNFYEMSSPIFKQEVNWLLRPLSIEFDDLQNGRKEAIHRLVNSLS